jgi:hypothetical protein
MSDHPLIGTWRLVSYELESATGTISYPYGHDPSGYLIYAADGYMSVAFMTGDRTPYAGGDRLRGTPEERAAAAGTYVSYCGRYELREDRVIHHIEVSLFPNWVGVAQTRYFTLAGTQLTLRTPPLLMGGSTQTACVLWERATDIHPGA